MLIRLSHVCVCARVRACRHACMHVRRVLVHMFLQVSYGAPPRPPALDPPLITALNDCHSLASIGVIFTIGKAVSDIGRAASPAKHKLKMPYFVWSNTESGHQQVLVPTIAKISTFTSSSSKNKLFIIVSLSVVFLHVFSQLILLCMLIEGTAARIVLSQ